MPGSALRAPSQAALPFAGPATDARAALERDWTDLVHRDLPAAARPGWPVRLDHCFARILLDNATGGVWYDAIAGRPARRHAPDAILRAAIDLGRAVLDGRADLAALNAGSLAWRGKAGRRGQGAPIRPGAAAAIPGRLHP